MKSQVWSWNQVSHWNWKIAKFGAEAKKTIEIK